MNLNNLHVCPSTLQPGFTTYSPLAQRDLFGSRTKKVAPVLPFGPPGKNPELTRAYNEKRKRISISGVQEKYSLALRRNALELTASKGTHILKPVPAERLERIDDLPANEHVSMQIARQVMGMKTAACGMLFFNDGSPAYLTRRFDYRKDGSKYGVEDFATLLGKTPEGEGDDYKYNASYLAIAQLIQKYVAATPVVLLDFFKLVVFNYLIGNGDAHLKNFALMESDQGDYLLAPAYDLMCTALHLDDTPLALHDGLYPKDHEEPSYLNFGCYTRQSFVVFGERIGLPPKLAGATIDGIMRGVLPAMEMVDRSFLSAEAKERYKAVLRERQRQLGLG